MAAPTEIPAPGRAEPGPPGPPRRPRNSLMGASIKGRRLLADRAFKLAVIGGGVAIIACILGILLFIAWEVWPLLSGAEVVQAETHAVADLPAGRIVGDEYRELGVHLGVDGVVRVVRLDTGTIVESRPLDLPAPADGEPSPARLRAIEVIPGTDDLAALTADGRSIVLPVSYSVDFDERQRRIVRPVIGTPLVLPVPPAEGRVTAAAIRADGDDGETAAFGYDDGGLVLVRRTTEENFLTGESTVETATHRVELGAPVIALLLDADGVLAVAGLADGRLALLPAADDLDETEPRLTEPGAPVTALTFLIGDRAVVAGREDGSLGVLFPLRDEAGAWDLVPVREFPRHDAPIARLTPSMRKKGFLALDERGTVGLYYSTSRRTLWRGPAPLDGARDLFFAPRGDGAVFSAPGAIASLDIDNPHPEVSLRTLFGRVWYEGYRQPELVWQSSSGSDDFEPKIGLTPLIAGTLKGTFYSLILAIPIGVFGAMYASEFMHPALKRYIKPTVEIMAALPSVVLGFLAGLWFAPRLEAGLPSLLLLLVVAPLAVIAVGTAWRRLPGRVRNRLPDGIEVALYGAAIVVVGWISIELSPAVESVLFAGSVPQWLYETTGLQYDQRNAIVVGLAMGFAVIPIIFSVAEDAFSNVPRSLVSGSLALGATRWQTVTRVVLPTASPGIFSAIMIGFGRAVGETMIVLMATGNTPIMDWSPFNGFRTLSANIAVEIPEAPKGETLYRTLFLAALLLFMLTFLINTAAELVRDRLRRRYANL